MSIFARLIVAALVSVAFVACGDDEANDSPDVGVDDAGTDVVQQEDVDSDADCGDYDEATSCEADASCHWVVATCDGDVVGESCFDEDTHPTPPPCDELEPEQCQHQSTQDACDPVTCDWLQPGCDDPPSESIGLDSATCVMAELCADDSDCPDDFSCESLWEDPCHNADCGACGGETSRCWPDE